MFLHANCVPLGHTAGLCAAPVVECKHLKATVTHALNLHLVTTAAPLAGTVFGGLRFGCELGDTRVTE